LPAVAAERVAVERQSPPTIVRSNTAIAFFTCSIVICPEEMPKALLKACAYSLSVVTTLMIGSWSFRPISTGFTNGCCDWSSRSGERPSQNCLEK
jgi:hypothetical protein